MTLTPDAEAPQVFAYIPQPGETSLESAASLAVQIDISSSFAASAVDEAVYITPDGTTTYITAVTADVGDPSLFKTTTVVACPIRGGSEGEVRLQGGISAGSETVTIDVTLTDAGVDTSYGPFAYTSYPGQTVQAMAKSIADQIDATDQMQANTVGGTVMVLPKSPTALIKLFGVTVT